MSRLRRFARQTFTCFAAVSLLLCVAVCVLWVRSYKTWYLIDGSGRITYGPSSDEARAAYYFCAAENGGLVVETAHYHFVTPGRTVAPQMPLSRIGSMQASPNFNGGATAKHWLGFVWVNENLVMGGPLTSGVPTTFMRHRWYKIPFWFIAPCTVLLPAHRLFLWHRVSRRRAAGRCVHCGYDLRATPQRCPECGTVPLQNCA